MAANISQITQQAEQASTGLRGQAGHVSRSCPAVTLNIGVFFDGTGNNANNTQSRGSTSSYQAARSNVALLSLLYKDGEDYDVENSCGAIGTKYTALYVEGIGTTANWSDRWPSNIVGAATGMGLTGVEARVFSACREIGRIVNRLSPGVEPREIILDVFGFSRGAAAARYFVNCFRQGYVFYMMFGTVPRYAYLPAGRNVRIRFIGIFDTVAAIGVASNDDNGAVNVHLSSAQADDIFHLTAMHEYRNNFRLNHNLPGGGDAREMLGAHSDVGGGYSGTGDRVRVEPARSQLFFDRATADAALANATRAAEQARNSAQSFWVQDGWIRPNEPVGGLVNQPTLRTTYTYSRTGAVRTQYLVETGAILDRPWVQVGLSRIPLRAMYDRAIAANVPFLSFPAGDEYRVPPRLAELAGGHATGGPLPAVAQRREILREYGHVSADLSSIGMEPQRGGSGQRLWVRTTYPNRSARAK